MIRVEQCTNQQLWDDYVIDHHGHPLQLWGWGQVKAAHNWRVERVLIHADDAIIGAAQLLIRPLPWPLQAMVYVSRGPVVDEAHQADVLDALRHHAKSIHHAAVLTIEPHWRDFPADVERAGDWQPSEHTILIPRTLILDLTKSEDELQAAMTKKTRQYIRKSQKDGVTIRRATSDADIAACLSIYHDTAARAGFPLHADQYYYDIFRELGDHSPVFIAEVEGDPVAFLWLAISGAVAFELYGGITQGGQHLRANYALKWHAITTMQQWGIDEYDMNGLLNDGISTFKQGFAEHEDQLVGTYDAPLSPLYPLWDKGLPLAKKALRLLKRR